MAFFYYDVRGKWNSKNLHLTVPTDKYAPKEHMIEELDALKIPQDRRDGCKDYYAEFKKCIMVQH